ncbi:hypothetical protein EW146_g5093 [Bondarzewia mesenterica]|uniref:Importin N-terminal domain-containing protein n=1 Tax=Bondarzewia mesenterica TaxID=1095465 RepID=A0A4S4LT47_9AGAM|nr:hypothetical protein EW146_g5093 [Bondarzewia mesenterica]
MTSKAASLQHVSPQELYNALCGAASQNPAEMQASSERLKELLELCGSCNALQEIASQKTVLLPVRQLSIIQFKNRISNRWRSRRPSLPTDLVSLINSKLEMRYTSSLSDPHSTLVLHRALRVLYAFVKEFSQMNFGSQAAATGQLVEQFHIVLSNHYLHLVEPLLRLELANLCVERVAEDLLFVHIIFKCLAHLAVWLRRKSQRAINEKFEAWFTQLFQTFALHLKTLSESRNALMHSLRSSNVQPDAVTERSLTLLSRHILTMGKFFRRLQQIDAAVFVALPSCDNLVSYYWDKVVQANASPDLIADSLDAVYPIRFLVQGMVLFKDSLAQWTPVRKDGSENVAALPKEFVERAVTLLVTNFMPLKSSDLEGWMADPEEWVNSEEKEDEQWVFEIRPCAERVLLTLANQYRDYVAPLLTDAFNQVVAQPTVTLQDVIQKEAIYCAVGRCAHRLKDSVDFAQWLNVASTEVHSTNTDFLIIKRRIAWLIGKWVGEKCAMPNDIRVWQILLHLLADRGTGTEVVRLTAAAAVKDCVNALDFDANLFFPYLGGIIAEIIQLIGETETLETKRKVAGFLSTVIKRAGTTIIPVVGVITGPLPQLWNSAGEDFLFKASILRIVTVLVSSLKEVSVSQSGVVVPLVRESFTSDSISHLDDDALNLWLTALRNTTTIEGVSGNPGLIDLVPLAISLLASNLDLLGKITNIFESCYLLDAGAVLQRYSGSLFLAYRSAMDQAPLPNTKGLAVSLNLLFQMAPPALYAEGLHVSGLFSKLMKAIVEDDSDTILLTHYITIMARMTLADVQTFCQLMTATATALNTPETELWEGLLDQWWRRFDNMYEPRIRKLSGMSIAALVSTGRPEVLERLHSEIFNLWMDVFSELKETLEKKQEESLNGETTILTLYWDQPPTSFYSGTEHTPEYERRKASFDNDPVRTTPFAGFIATRLQQAEIACGGTQVMQTQYLAKADPIVVKSIMDEIRKK